MFNNYLRIALRILKRQKIYSFINISGLAIGISCCIVILLFVQDELSYDKYHENVKCIYRVATEMISPSGKKGSTKTWSWIAPNMISDFPGVISASRIYRYGGVLNYDKKHFGESLFFVDPSFLDIFTFPLFKGDKQIALRDPNSALITEELAEKYFGDDNPLGKVLMLDGKYSFKINGILRNIPKNSHFSFGFLASFDNLRNIYGKEEYQKGNLLVRTYLLLDNNVAYKELEEEFHNFVVRYKGEKFASRHNYFLQPLTSIHLHSNLAVELAKNSDIAYSYALSGIALVILLLACINFMNLSTARAFWRSKEVGMRKVIGASRAQLFRQFIGESVFISFIALLLAIVLAELFLPFFNSLVDKDLSINFSQNLFIYTALILLIIFVGFVSGSYPAIFLSSFQPIDVIKGNLKKSTLTGLLFRKGLIIFQFAISLFFIIGTIIVFRQVNFMKNTNLGFDKDYVIKISFDKTIRQHYKAVKNELLQNLNIIDVTASLAPPGRLAGLELPFVPEGLQDEKVILNLNDVDHNFFEFFRIDVVEGRDFSKEIASDIESAFVLNEAAVKKIGWELPIGKKLKCEGFRVKGTVVGVAKDFHNVSLYEEIKPSIFRVNPQYFSLFVRIRPNNIQGAISFLEEKMREFSPQLIFRYSFLDEHIAAIYIKEKKVNKVFGFSSLLSIIIACLGLFGLVSFSVEQRTKEIGIRKVIGASVTNILLLLSKEFVRLVIISNIVAWPIVYFVMNKWLQNFAYRIHIGWWIFFIAGALALVISLLTVSYQAVKAALANPVETLRYE